MGILNITPDSFYGNSRISNEEQLLIQAKQMVAEGVTILDIGGASSRPGAKEVSTQEEMNRVLPAIRLIQEECPEVLLSIDTFWAKVADEALKAGASIVNDISAGNIDPEIMDVAASNNAPYIAMHMQGTPQTMQQQPTYDNALKEIFYYFSERIEQCHLKGIHDVIIDPGFGFGKTQKHNYELLRHLESFQQLGHPVLMGISRKSMIWKTLNNNPEMALNGTTVLHTIGIQKGVQILRVHDVREAMECIQLTEQLFNHFPAATTN